MAIGKAPFDVHLKGIKAAFHTMVKPYHGLIQVKGTQFGMVTFEMLVSHDTYTVKREVGPFDMAEDFDHKTAQEKVARKLADAVKDMVHEMMDPDGECQTISVKDVYAEMS